MSYSYRKQHQQYDDLPLTNPGEDRQPVYRREEVDGEPRLVVDHWISQQEMIESDRPLDIQEIVKRAMRGDPSVLGDGSRAIYADVSDLGDINDLYDSAMALKMSLKQFEDGPVSGTVENIDNQPKEVTTTNES